MFALLERRESVGAIALSALLVASILAIAVVPTGLSSGATDTDLETSNPSLETKTHVQTTDTENFEGGGDPVATEDGDPFHNDGHEKDGLLYVVTDQVTRVVVYKTDFEVVDEHTLSHSASGITRFDGQWIIANWEDDTLHTYDDDFTQLDSTPIDVVDDFESPWNIDADGDRLYVTDDSDIQVYDSDLEQIDTITTGLEPINPLHVVNDRVFVMEANTDDTVYEFDTDGTQIDTYQATPETGTYEEQTRSMYLFNGNWYVHDLAGDGDAYRFPASITSTATLSGTLTDTRGEPVANATITGTGVTDVGFDGLDETELEAEANALLKELEDPLPDSFDADYDFDAHTDADATYTLVHQPGDWGVGTTTIFASSIDDPRVTVDQNRDVVISLWDPTEDGGLLENQVDQSFPGAAVEGTIIIDQLAPTGETTDSRTLETHVVATSTGVNPLTTNDHHAVRTNLPPGVYHTYPESNEGLGVTFTVGDPDELAQQVIDDLRDEADQLTERAERIQSLTAEETLVTETTTTDENGEFTLEIDQRVQTVSLYPVATPDQTQLPDDPSLEDLHGLESDLFVPTPETSMQTYAPPDEGVQLTVYRTPTLPYEELEAFDDLLSELEAAFFNESLEDLDGWVQRLEEITGEQQADLVDELEAFLESELEDLEAELTGDDNEDLETLLERLDELEESVTVDPGIDDGGYTDISDGELPGLLDLEFPVPSDIDTDDVLVLTHTSSGETVPIDSAYWEVQSDGFLAGNVVTLTENPFEGDNVGVVTLEVHVTGDDGYGSGSEQARNPGFDGDLPGLESLLVSTLEPEPGERVSIDVNTDAEAAPATVVDAELFDADSDTQPVSITDDRLTFEPESESVHHLRVTLETTDGGQFVVSERLRVGAGSRADRATLRVGASPLGMHAVATEGIEAATVERSGGVIDVQATVDESPGEFHVQPERVLSGTDHEFSVTLETETGEELEGHVPVFIHLENYDSDEGVHWRNGAAFTVDGDTRHGEVLEYDDSQVVVTYTDDTGSLESVEVIEDAGWGDRLEHWVDLRVPDISWPSWLAFVFTTLDAWALEIWVMGLERTVPRV
ncbi:hypothetical protein [Natronosalvus amylolyticus]|uniref:hypothetical protein n=1 Tax=Natronosalvus amylolyticus TaxID=2961994 RepID=UPI0020C96B8B|nr:hypothetical protein [Natronosalvus amylolyticus]